MSEPIFELKDVHFSYLGKYPALCGVDIRIEKGQEVAFIGANGSGKSTLLHMLDGLIFPARGTVMAFGKELSDRAFSDQEFSRNFRMKVGLVFQNPDIQLFCPTVKEDILFGPLHLGMGKKEIERRLEKVVDLLDVGKLLDRSPHQLSLGEKKRVAIASILIMEPEIVLLDEPTASLDPRTSRHLIDAIVQLGGKGCAVIISTQDIHIVSEIADRVIVMGEDKRIAADGKAEDILKDTALLEEHNLIHIHSHKHKGAIHAHPHEHPSHDHSHMV